MASYAVLRDKIERREAVCGVIGLGYVGLPLAVEMAHAGLPVVGFDVSASVVDRLRQGESHIADVPTERVTEIIASQLGPGRLHPTTDLARLAECDVISICVPTPLGKTKDPDMHYVLAAANAVAATLRPGQLIVLESTTYPGTTRELLQPLFERGGLAVGRDIFLAFSPERVDPGNPTWTTTNTPKVLGGITPQCTELGALLYGQVVQTVVRVPSPEAAELSKLYENTFRMINIALANEMAIMCDRLGVNVWDVIEAAATKPFGFMKFTPGPGLGGHCIPLDPHYLAWRMRAEHYTVQTIAAAEKINAGMPEWWVGKVQAALNERSRSLKGARVLILGVTYKKDCNDVRESPALEILGRLATAGAHVRYHDPHCPEIVDDGHVPAGAVGKSVPLTDDEIRRADCILIVTDHTAVDYKRVVRHGRLILDTRNVLPRS